MRAPPPPIAYVPLFAQLRTMRASKMAIAVYGAIAAYQRVGYHPSIAVLGWTAGHHTKWAAKRAIAELVRLRVLRRTRVGAQNVYDLLGPTLE